MSSKGDRERVELKFRQAVADMGMTQQEFSDRSSYWNYLQDELIVKQNCSNQFAWRGEQTCPVLTDDTSCEHVKAVAKAMDEKYRRCEGE